jgi:SAM-dependent methyltransferase
MAGVQAFNQSAERYEAWFRKNWDAYQAEVRALKELMPSVGNAVEIGVGSGRFAAPLGARFGVDPSRVMLQIASGRGVDAVRGVGEALPFVGACFDTALMVTTVCFLDDIDQALRETGRILRRDGRIVVGFVDRTSPLGQTYLRQRDESLFYRAAQFYTVKEIVRSLRQVGFHEFDFRQTLFAPPAETTPTEPVTIGYGDGSFIVIRATLT